MVVGVRKAKGEAAAEANLGEDVLMARDEDTDGHFSCYVFGKGAGAALPMNALFIFLPFDGGKEDKKKHRKKCFSYKDVCCSKEERDDACE